MGSSFCANGGFATEEVKAFERVNPPAKCAHI